MGRKDAGKLNTRLLAGTLFLAVLMFFVLASRGQAEKAKNYSDPVAVERDRMETGMIRYKFYAEVNEIPNMYLFIGTYLMDSRVVNAQYYDLAKKSMTKHSQENQLYKSELAEGTWKDISSGGLDAIVKTGRPVPDSEMADLWISHVIGEDGVARDPITGEPKDLFDNAYDLLGLEELKPLKLKYDEIYNKWDRTAIEEQHVFITRMGLVKAEGEYEKTFSTMGENEITEEADHVIEVLKTKYYQPYLSGDEKEYADQILKLIASEDAVRRSEIFAFLSMKGDDSRLNQISRMIANGAGYRGNPEEFDTLKDYSDAITKSLWNCRTTYQDCQASILTPGETVMSMEVYETSQKVIEAAAEDKGPQGEIQDAVDRLYRLSCVDNERIEDAEPELMVCNELIAKAHDRYDYPLPDISDKQSVDADTYDREMAAASAKLDRDRAEIEKFIQAKVDRQIQKNDGDVTDSLEYVCAELNLYYGLQDQNAGNPYADEFTTKYLRASHNAHIEWLKSLFEDIKKRAEGEEPGDAEYNDLKAKYDRAVDDEDFAKARDYELQLKEFNRTEEEEEKAAVDTGAYDGQLPFDKDIGTINANLTAEGKSLISKKDFSLADIIALYLSGDGDSDGIMELMREAVAAQAPEELIEDMKMYLTVAHYVADMDETGYEESDEDAAGAGDGGTDGSESGSGSGTEGGSGSGSGSGAGAGSGADAGTGSGSGSGSGGAGSGAGADGNADGSKEDEDSEDEKILEDLELIEDDDAGEEEDDPYALYDDKVEDKTGSARNAVGKGKYYVAPNKGNNQKTTLTKSNIDNAILKAFGGKSFGELGADAKAAVVVALHRFGQQHNDQVCKDYAKELLSRIMEEKNVLVYGQYTGDSVYEYISFGAIDNARSYTGYRHMHEDEDDSLGKINDKAYIGFIFQVGSPRMALPDGRKDVLSSEVVAQKDYYLDASGSTRYPYMTETDAMRLLGFDAEYIKGTTHSVLITPVMDKMVKKIMDALEEAAGIA